MHSSWNDPTAHRLGFSSKGLASRRTFDGNYLPSSSSQYRHFACRGLTLQALYLYALVLLRCYSPDGLLVWFNSHSFCLAFLV